MEKIVQRLFANTIALVLLLGVSLWAAPAPAPAPAPAAASAPAATTEQCSMEALKKIAPSDAVLDKVEVVNSGTSQCRVDGHIITMNPGPNTVNFRVQLPLSGWKNRYFLPAQGGNAGLLPNEREAEKMLVQGFVVAGTDTGHRAEEGFAFFDDKVKDLDYHRRAIHVTAVATQAITKKFYHTQKLYRYLAGCSGGGGAAYNSGTNYPQDFDGLVAGAPGQNTKTILAYAWVVQKLMKRPNDWISPAKLIHLEQAILEKCDMSDGVKDDMVWDPRSCKFDPHDQICKGADQETCLTPGQADIIRDVLAGPHNSHGQIYPGMSPTNISIWSPSLIGPVPPPWSDTDPKHNFYGYTYSVHITKNYFGPDFDFVRQLDFSDPTLSDRWDDAVRKEGVLRDAEYDRLMTDEWLERGPKLIVWQGVSDPNVSYLDTINFWKKGRAGAKSPEKFDSKTRLYLVPGMTHCGGGTGPTDTPDRLLDAIVAWVEEGKAPEGVVSHRDTNGNARPGQMVPNPAWKDLPPREFLLCPQPQRSVFIGKSGDEGKAASWICKAT
jgi:feruloyl esterase